MFYYFNKRMKTMPMAVNVNTLIKYYQNKIRQSLSCRKGVLADVKDYSNVALACDDDTHKVVLFACSLFFKISRGELIQVGGQVWEVLESWQR